MYILLDTCASDRNSARSFGQYEHDEKQGSYVDFVCSLCEY